MSGRDENSDLYNEEEVHAIDSLWNLSEDFSIDDAAALIAGYNPAMVERCFQDTFFDREFPRYPIALKSLTNAITNGRLKASLRYSAREYGYVDQLADIDYSEAEAVQSFGNTAEDDEVFAANHSCFYKPFPDWALSTVSRDDLVLWLSARGVRSGFFFAAASNAPNYLDRENPRYANKLAAAVCAWQAVTDPGGKHPKQALAKWLREHAAELGLSDDEGKPNETGIEEVAKVANWKPGGGAPKTPGE